jgi:hypothetical protein
MNQRQRRGANEEETECDTGPGETMGDGNAEAGTAGKADNIKKNGTKRKGKRRKGTARRDRRRNPGTDEATATAGKETTNPTERVKVTEQSHQMGNEAMR